jgi:hypothetical protein
MGVECVYKCSTCGRLNSVRFEGNRPPVANWGLIQCQGCHIPEDHLEKWQHADLLRVNVLKEKDNGDT